MPDSFDVIVVGVGAMGASACFHLATGGASVLGLEQFDIPHARGSSHGHSRMIRSAYYEEPRYVPLLRRAYVLWDQLEAMSGLRLLHRVGGLYVGPTDGMLVDGARKAADAHTLDHEMLDHRELRRRWPQFVVPDDWRALLDPAAGFLRPELIISSYAELAMRTGATIHAREAVRSWKADAGGVVVTTDRGEYRAAELIFTGGAWTAKLLTGLGVDLQVTRQVLGWVWPKQPNLFQLGRIPAWAIDSCDGGIYYGFPMMPDIPGFKLAHHLPGKPFDPDTGDREPRPEDEDDFRPALRRYIPEADGPLIAMRICMYTNTADGNFIIDRHPDHPRVQIACGFSGHGFKFASVIGEILAQRAADPGPRPDVEFLRIDRPSLQRRPAAGI